MWAIFLITLAESLVCAGVVWVFVCPWMRRKIASTCVCVCVCVSYFKSRERTLKARIFLIFLWILNFREAFRSQLEDLSLMEKFARSQSHSLNSHKTNDTKNVTVGRAGGGIPEMFCSATVLFKVLSG